MPVTHTHTCKHQHYSVQLESTLQYACDTHTHTCKHQHYSVQLVNITVCLRHTHTHLQTSTLLSTVRVNITACLRHSHTHTCKHQHYSVVLLHNKPKHNFILEVGTWFGRLLNVYHTDFTNYFGSKKVLLGVKSMVIMRNQNNNNNNNKALFCIGF